MLHNGSANLRNFAKKREKMKFRPGDKVKFKDEPGMGVVIRVDAKGLVYVETEDGFERPVYPSDLMHTQMYTPEVPVTGEKDSPEQAESIPPAPEYPETEDMPPVGEEETSVFLGVIQEAEKFAFYLINDSAYDLTFTFGHLRKDGGAVLLERGDLEPGTKYLLAELLPERDQLLFVQGLLSAGRSFVPRPPLDKQIPFGTDSLPRAREFKENPYFDEKAWLISLLPEKVKEPQIKIEEKKKKEILRSKGDLKPPRRKMMIRPGITGHEPVEEVDLHIEEIVESTEGMSNGEILEVQLARFETALEGAIRNGQKKIVFIHGLGQGKLKNEVRKRLDKRNISYQDAPFKEYGYGATVVLLK